MEYYSGILFLTTNKVGTLDEAFRSRVYLSLNDTPEILQSNLRRLPRIKIAIDKSSNGGYIRSCTGKSRSLSRPNINNTQRPRRRRRDPRTGAESATRCR